MSTASPAPANPDLSRSHKLLREKRLKWAIASSLMIRPLAVLIPVIVIPVFIRYLGTERYGLYEAVASLAAWVGLSNIGLGFGLTNHLIDCHVADDRRTARIYVSTLFVAMLALLIVGVLAITAFSLLVPWRQVFGATSQVGETELRWSVWLACVLPLLAMTLNCAPAVHAAHQEIHRQNLWDGAARVTTILACLAVPFLGLGIPGAILAISCMPVLVSLLNHANLWLFSKPWLRPQLSLFQFAGLRSLLGDGILLFVLQSSAVLMFQADRLVIGLIRTPAEVTEYGVVNRIFMLAYGAFYLVLTALWPAYGEALRRGDIGWCRAKLRITASFGVGIMLSCGLLLGFGGDQIVRLLAGSRAFPVPLAMVVGMTLACCMRAWADAHSILLNGANCLLPQVFLLGANALLALLANVGLTYWFGPVGTAWSFPLAAALTTVWGYPWIFRRFLRGYRFSRPAEVPGHCDRSSSLTVKA